MTLLYGRARRLTAKNGGFRPGQLSDELAVVAVGFALSVPALVALALAPLDCVFASGLRRQGGQGVF
jgi:hypothetical protein